VKSSIGASGYFSWKASFDMSTGTTKPCIFLIGENRIRVPDDADPIIDRADSNFLIESGIVRVLGEHTPVTNASNYLTIGTLCVSVASIAPVFDIANKPSQHFGGIWIAARVNSDHLEARAHQSNVAGDLVNEARKFVYG
jgi:hypothetical protein